MEISKTWKATKKKERVGTTPPSQTIPCTRVQKNNTQLNKNVYETT